MSIYLHQFTLPSGDEEFDKLVFNDPERKANMGSIYNSCYPFKVFSRYFKRTTFDFEPITMIYGGNGSVKSTILNLIAYKLDLDRASRFSTTDFFDDYSKICDISYDKIPRSSKIITSDDVFRKLNDVRAMNEMIDKKRSEMLDFRRKAKYNPSKFSGLEDFDRWQEQREAARSTASKFILDRVGANLESRSNGETALKYLTDEITENALYLLDEPENSLSPAFQLELKQFIEDSARFYRCQFVISTHSPLLLSANGAKIYNLDDEAEEYEWYELENVRVFAKFFLEHADKFGDD